MKRDKPKKEKKGKNDRKSKEEKREKTFSNLKFSVVLGF